VPSPDINFHFIDEFHVHATKYSGGRYGRLPCQKKKALNIKRL